MRQVTQTDVAKAAGVSRGLVSLALSGSDRVAPSTAKKIRQVAEGLGYSRNFTAATLASARSTLVGMILPNLKNPYFESLVSAYQNEADVRGLVTLAATASSESGRLEKLLSQFEQMRVRGIILVTPDGSEELYGDLAKRYPIVAVGVPGMGKNINTVHIDEREAARLIVEHLNTRNYSELCYVVDSGADSATKYRLDAICSAATEGDVSLRVDVRDSYIAQRLNVKRGECYLVHNDLMAIDVISAIKAAGLKPGKDVPVISYDNTYLAEHPQFRITSVDQDPAQQAVLSFDMLDSEPGVAVEHVVEPRLVIRESSRARS